MDDCNFVKYDERNEGYCHASKMNGPMDCPYADYAGKSLYPPCTKHWIKGESEKKNVANYNQNFRGK